MSPDPPNTTPGNTTPTEPATPPQRSRNEVALTYVDELTAADRAHLDQRERDLTASIRLRCLEVAERLDPFGSVRRRLAERAAGDDQTEPAVEQTIALARRLETYVLGQEGPTT